jgi:HAD superfamily hydrolase (TIGR01509 family)
MTSHLDGRPNSSATFQRCALSHGMTHHQQSPEAVIFDVDGTLLDSVDKHAMSWVEAFHAFGHRVAVEEVRSQIGKGGDQLMPVFMTPEEIEEYGEDLEAERATIFRNKYLPLIKPFCGVRALFERVHAEGKRVVLASSASRDELAAYKTIANIEGLVDAETSSDDAKRSKPYPDIFQAALDRLGVRGDRTIAVGDTPYDAQAAAKAGIRTIGLLCGGWSGDDLKRSGCIAVYKDPADLLALYEVSPLA